MITYFKFHKRLSIRIFSCNIKINRWCIAVFKNIIKFKVLWIAKVMFPVGNIFLLHVIYKMQDLCIIWIVMIKIKRNIVIIEHLYKIGIKTSFTITMEINGRLQWLYDLRALFLTLKIANVLMNSFIYIKDKRISAKFSPARDIRSLVIHK